MIGLMSRRFMVLRRTGGLRSLGDFKAVTADLCQELVAMALQVVGRGAVDGDAHAAHKVGAGGIRRRIVAALHARQHRSEEHTSELQSLMRISYAVFFLKKK